MTVTQFLLVIVLRFSVGDPEPVVIVGDTYPTLDACMAQGDVSAEWLTQDFVAVEYRCVKENMNEHTE